MPGQYLCDCHGLLEFLSPSLTWRGSLSFSDTQLSHVSLPGFELHHTRDQRHPSTGAGRGEVRRHVSAQLEVVAPVSVTSVLAQPQLVSGERLELRTPLLDDDQDDLSRHFMTTGFPDPDSGYLMKLKYSLDKPKLDQNMLKTEQWKKKVINCEFSNHPQPGLGSDVHSVNVLVFDEEAADDSDCSRATLKKTVVVLKNAEDLGQLYNLRQSLSQQETDIEDVETVVSGLQKFEFDSGNLTKLKHYIRNVQDKVFDLLNESKHHLLERHSEETLLIAIQDEILKNVEMVIRSNGNIDRNDIDQCRKSLEDREEHVNKTVNSITDDWQEVRFLKYLSLYSEQEEQERLAQIKMMKPSEEEYVLLEARELIKYFDSNGLPNKPGEEVEVKNNKGSLRPQKCSEDYEKLMKQNFDIIPDTDFSLKGFKFKEEKDFSKIEFTKYHDVYYNTGLDAESFDQQTKTYRDCKVGTLRETKSTFSADDGSSTRMKVTTKKIVVKEKTVTERRSSPRKKVSQPLNNISNKKPTVVTAARKTRPDKSENKLDVSRSSDKSGDRRKSGGQESWGGELTEVNRKKLRVAVYTALLSHKIDEKNPLFKKCFPKLFSICKMYIQDGPDE